MLLVALLVAWMVLGCVASAFIVRAAERRKLALRRRAAEELLHEKGIARGPDESLKGALLRARRSERPPPMMEMRTHGPRVHRAPRAR